MQETKVAALFGCWTSVSRKSVLPVVEQNDALLYYPLHFEGEENSKNVVYMNSPPSNSVLPAVDYPMGPDGGSAKRFFMLGSDYVWPRTINKILKAYWTSKGIQASSWKEEYVPFGFSNFQNLVNQIRSFASKGSGQPIVVLTVVGSSIPDFLSRTRKCAKLSIRRWPRRATLWVSDTLSLLYNGLSAGSVLFLASAGLAIIFGLMGVINLAQGEFIMLGAYTTYWCRRRCAPTRRASSTGAPFSPFP